LRLRREGEDDQKEPGIEPCRELLERSTERREETLVKSIHETVPVRLVEGRVSL